VSLGWGGFLRFDLKLFVDVRPAFLPEAGKRSEFVRERKLVRK
jgi:hypothetical protein